MYNKVYVVGNDLTRKPVTKRIWESRYIYVMLFLPVVFFVVFKYVPMYGIILAFKQYTLKGIMASPWVGWHNFERMWISPDFIRALKNTLTISVYRIIFGFPIPVILAILVNEIRASRFSRGVQIIYTVPHFLSWVVIGGMMTLVLGDNGIVKNLVQAISSEAASNYNIMYNASLFRALLVITSIWKEAGWATIMYLAIIIGINPSLYESATLDGANRFQLVRHITIPCLLGIMCIQLILSVASVMDGAFDQIFNLMTPSTRITGDTIDTYIYRLTFSSNVAMDYGFTTAVGLFKTVINFILLFAANNIVRRLGGNPII